MEKNRFIKRPLSFSQLSAWEWSKEEWYSCYIKNKPRGRSTAMDTGTLIGDSIGTERSLVPELQPPGIKEFELKANLGDIHIVGFADHYCPERLELNENKTSTNRTKWTPSTVKKHKQLDMYALLLFMQHGIEPSKVTMFLNYIPVIEGPDMRYYLPDPVEHYRYETKRSAGDVTAYTDYIIETVRAMDEFIHMQDALESDIVRLPVTGVIT